MKTKVIFIPAIKCNITYYIGSNAQDNWDIIDNASPDDIWFHIDGSSSCHVIASICENTTFDKKDKRYIIKQGALLCKENSKYKSERNLKITYTSCKNVKKIEGSPGTVSIPFSNSSTINI
jgi:predicted ribosome quality control (RQC) complex YloA/Tae2 family protein